MNSLAFFVILLPVLAINTLSLPLESCRHCCDSFNYGSSFQIGCRTVGCLIGEAGVCPGGSTPANAGCNAGKSLVTFGTTIVEGQEFFCEHSDNHGAALFETSVKNTIDQCSSCCSVMVTYVEGIDIDSCKNGCRNFLCQSDISCLVGLDFMISGPSNKISGSIATCNLGIFSLETFTTRNPTTAPTSRPSLSPTTAPSFNPTKFPSQNPSFTPSTAPTSSPSLKPTNSPTILPTSTPSTSPTPDKTLEPTKAPVERPTTLFPTQAPTTITESPSQQPTNNPISSPTGLPSTAPDTPIVDNVTAAPTLTEEQPAIKDLAKASGGGFTATIVGLVAGIIVSSGLCIFFLSTNSTQRRYITRTSLPQFKGNASQLYASCEGPMTFT